MPPSSNPQGGKQVDERSVELMARRVARWCFDGVGYGRLAADRQRECREKARRALGAVDHVPASAVTAWIDERRARVSGGTDAARAVNYFADDLLAFLKGEPDE
jgi:hypothetical protein